ncbi:FAD-binding domain-containing protein [Streptomyces sp. NPDC048156]|uniref:FAD-binding domain-containing protein n=1 Tax=Streptomyces sp. NPDC048156 TaxID=3365502 RepID=UPI00372154CC
MAQARRYDPDGTHVRRWVPDLSGLTGPTVHEPWKLPGPQRAAHDFPDPIVALPEGLDRLRRALGLD